MVRGAPQRPSLGRVGRLWCRRPERAARVWRRPGRVHGLRVRYGHRPHADVPQRLVGHAGVLRRRRTVHPGIRHGGSVAMRVSVSWLREYVALPADLTAQGLEDALTNLGIEV